MSNSRSYDQWASTYDSVVNPTRDIESEVMREMLSTITFHSVLELGCGTGKNTAWLAAQNRNVTAVDFSPGMLSVAGEKLPANIRLIDADITKPWNFLTGQVDLITTSLVLEHIDDLSLIFRQAAKALHRNGYFYIGELHPFKQYSGSKARFEKDDESHVLECFVHHFSDYVNAAVTENFSCLRVIERSEPEAAIPRILAMLFRLK